MTFSSVLQWCKGFVEENTPQSSARFLAILLGVSTAICAPAAIIFAFHHPHEWQTVAALGGTTVTAMSGAMAYALKVRKVNFDTATEDKG